MIWLSKLNVITVPLSAVIPPVLLLGDSGSLLWLAGWSIGLLVSVLLQGLWDFLFLMRIFPISSEGLGSATPASSCQDTQQEDRWAEMNAVNKQLQPVCLTGYLSRGSISRASPKMDRQYSAILACCFKLKHNSPQSGECLNTNKWEKN